MNNLRHNLFMRLLDLVMIASFGIACYLVVYCLKWQNESNEPYCVTYVASRTSSPCELCITYRDSTGIVTCNTKEENWSTQVCLPSHASAFLLVQSIYGSSKWEEELVNHTWVDDSLNDVFAKITCGTASTGYKGQGFVSVDYSPSTIR